MAAVAAAQPQEAVRQDAALQKGVELVLDELGQARIRGCLDLGEEGCGVLLHQAVQRGLLGAVALVVDRGATLRPVGLPTDGLHALLSPLPTDNAGIAAYLEARYPRPPLLGSTPHEKAEIASWNGRVEFEGLLAIAEAMRSSAPSLANRALPGPGSTMRRFPSWRSAAWRACRRSSSR